MIQTISCKDVKIRKDRQCFYCYRKYEKGTVMNCWTGKNDGEIYSIYSCMTCNQIIQKCEHDGDGFCSGFVIEMKNTKEETPEHILLRMTNETNK